MRSEPDEVENRDRCPAFWRWLQLCTFRLHHLSAPVRRGGERRAGPWAGEALRLPHGFLLYRCLLACDLNSDEGKVKLMKQKLRNTKCVGCVRDACRLPEEMLPAQMAG
jgi:hypothetical protein